MTGLPIDPNKPTQLGPGMDTAQYLQLCRQDGKQRWSPDDEARLRAKVARLKPAKKGA